MTKIAIICPRTKEYCGVYDYSTILASNLSANKNTDVTLITNENNFHSKEGGFTTDKFVKKWNFREVIKLTFFFKNNHFKIVNIQFVGWMYGRYGCPLPLAVMMIILKIFRIKTVFTAHELYVPMINWRWKILGTLQRIIFFTIALNASAIIVPIEKWQKLLHKNVMLKNKEIWCIPIYSNIGKSNDKFITRKSLGIKEDDFIITVFSPNGSGKMMVNVIQVFNQLKTIYPNLVLCILGCENKRKHNGIISVSQSPESEISNILRLSNAYFCPFIDGVSSRRGSLLAAMCHDLPIVTTIGESTDELFHESPVFMAQANDLNSMKLELSKLILDKRYRQEKSEKIKKFYQKYFDCSVATKKYLSLFTKLIDQKDCTNKILFIDQAKEIGGAELSLISIVKNIKNSTVGVFESGLFPERLKKEGVNTETLKIDNKILNFSKEDSHLTKFIKLIPSLFVASFKIMTCIRKYNIVCFNTQKALILGIIPAKLRRKKTVFFLRDIVSGDHFAKRNIKIIIHYANLCDKIICNSNATKDAFVLSGGNPNKCIVAYNGIDPLLFRNNTAIKISDLKISLGIEKKIIIGSFSRIAEWKGQHIMIEALSKLPSNFHCLIVGSPFFGEDDYYLRLKNLAKELDLSKRVQFVAFTQDISPLMDCCDIIVHTATSPEPFGRVIIEGMLMQKPVIATRLGATCEIIDDNINGYLIESNDPGILANKILQIQNDRKASSIVAINARKLVLEKYSEEIMTRKIQQEIDNL